MNIGELAKEKLRSIAELVSFSRHLLPDVASEIVREIGATAHRAEAEH
jgi:hypothetical protein